jgi:uncharacterized protein (TIGR02145 family)
MKDQDSNTYKIVTIGKQTWMAENLRTTKYRNGDPIPLVTIDTTWANLNSGASCYYRNTKDNDTILTFGRLYNWYAVIDKRNIAPAGWHVPSDAEWKELTSILGVDSIAGGKLKEKGLTHWLNPNTDATNETGFTALPGGSRAFDGYFGPFESAGCWGIWWSSTEFEETISKELEESDAWARRLFYSSSWFAREGSLKRNGLSIRCIKD